MSNDAGEMDKPGGAEQPGALTGCDRLFGRDLRRNGWFIDPQQAEEAARAALQEEREHPIDPALIWAMRGRRR